MRPTPPFMALLLAAIATILAPEIRALSADGKSTAAAPTPTSTNTVVLVVIDVQNFYFPGGPLPLSGPEAAGTNSARLLTRFRALGWPVVHVQHLPKDQKSPSLDAGDPQYRIHPLVLPKTGEAVVGKHHANAFRDTSLLETLRALRARRLVITGMQTHMCVEAAARAAADLGFEVIVPGDACATRPLKFGDAEVPAAQVHATTLASLQGAYARVISTAELLGELPQPAGR